MMKRNKIEQQGKLGAYLKNLRISQGMRQADLAENLGEPQSFISKVESGERSLTIYELEEIAAQFGLSLIDFLTQYQESQDETQP